MTEENERIVDLLEAEINRNLNIHACTSTELASIVVSSLIESGYEIVVKKPIRAQLYRALGSALVFVPVMYLVFKYANECKP